eukprot:12040625-Alexandrium_andersonii.AAC.1
MAMTMTTAKPGLSNLRNPALSKLAPESAVDGASLPADARPVLREQRGPHECEGPGVHAEVRLKAAPRVPAPRNYRPTARPHAGTA